MVNDPLYDHELDAVPMPRGADPAVGIDGRIHRLRAGPFTPPELVAAEASPEESGQGGGFGWSEIRASRGRQTALAGWIAGAKPSDLISLGLFVGLFVSLPMGGAMWLALRQTEPRLGSFTEDAATRPVAVPPIAVPVPPSPPSQPPPGPLVAEQRSDAPPPAPLVVPPLQEEAPEPLPVVTEETLKQLRAEYRQRRVLKLQTIMDGVRRACSSDDWQRSGWRDYPLEFALDELIYRVKRITERPALELPVRFGEVPAGVAENAKGVLTVSRSINLRGATRCIFLVDGDVELLSADGCLILATGRVNVRYGRACVILAGQYIDGTENMHPRENKPRPSLRISGSMMSLWYSSNLILAAPDGVEASSVQDAAFLNSPFRSLSYLSVCSEYASPRVDLRIPAPAVLGARVGPIADRDGGEFPAPQRKKSTNRAAR